MDLQKSQLAWKRQMSLIITQKYQRKPTTGTFRTNKKVLCLIQRLVDLPTQYIKVQLISDQKWITKSGSYSYYFITRHVTVML